MKEMMGGGSTGGSKEKFNLRKTLGEWHDRWKGFEADTSPDTTGIIPKLTEILDNTEITAEQKKEAFQDWCNTKFTKNGQPLGKEFTDEVGKSFDNLTRNMKNSQTTWPKESVINTIGNSISELVTYTVESIDEDAKGAKKVEAKLTEIFENRSLSEPDKKKAFQDWCHDKFTKNGQALEKDFTDAVGKMFDETLKKMNEESSIKRGAQKTGAAITKLVVGTIGLAVRIAGDALMFAGKALDMGSLTLLNSYYVASKVSPELAGSNIIIPNNGFNGHRLNAVQIAGTHLANAGFKMMNLGEVALNEAKKGFGEKIVAESKKTKNESNVRI